MKYFIKKEIVKLILINSIFNEIFQGQRNNFLCYEIVKDVSCNSIG